MTPPRPLSYTAVSSSTLQRSDGSGKRVVRKFNCN